MDQGDFCRNVSIVGGLHHGKTSFTDLLIEATHPQQYAKSMNITDVNKNTKNDVFNTNLRYLDTRTDEQERAISMKISPISTILQDLRGKSYLLTTVDAPGHIAFTTEAKLATRLSDGVVIVVDVIEGVVEGTKRAITSAIANSPSLSSPTPVIMVLNKIDRLILELRLPIIDAMRKIKNVIDEFNTALSNAGYPPAHLVSPVLDTVLFASTLHKWCFSLHSWVDVHISTKLNSATTTASRNNANNLRDMTPTDKARFAKKLWGNWWFNSKTCGFSKTPNVDGGDGGDDADALNTFGYFILEPLYKMYSSIVGSDSEDLISISKQLGVSLSKSESAGNVTFLLRTILSRCIGSTASIITSISNRVSPPSNTLLLQKLKHLYTGVIPVHTTTEDDARALSLLCSRSSDIMIADGIKNIPRPDGSAFDTLVRVLSGTMTIGQEVRLLGPEYTYNTDTQDSSDESEDGVIITTIKNIWIYQGRYRINISQACSGSLVLLEFTSPNVNKYSTITSTPTKKTQSKRNFTSSSSLSGKTILNSTIAPLLPPYPKSNGHVRVAIEPHNPSHLPRVLRAIHFAMLCYPNLETKIEPSGERTLFAGSEIEMDCILRDIRTVYVNVDSEYIMLDDNNSNPNTNANATNANSLGTEITIKVSDPSVRFCETVNATSSTIATSVTSNGKNTLAALAYHLDDTIIRKLESGVYGHDFKTVIASANTTAANTTTTNNSSIFTPFPSFPGVRPEDIWCFGPGELGPNILTNDLPRFGAGAAERRELVSTVSDSLIEGFQWAMKEGPLCEELVRNVKICVMEGTNISTIANERSRRHIIPTSRKVTYSALLYADMRLLEPICEVEVLLNSHGMTNALNSLDIRRGNSQLRQLKQDDLQQDITVMQNQLDKIFYARRGVAIDAHAKPGTPLASFIYQVPLIETFGLETDMRSGSFGQSFVSSEFSHWGIVPGNPLDDSIEISPLKIATDQQLAKDFMLKTRRRKGLPDTIDVSMYHK